MSQDIKIQKYFQLEDENLRSIAVKIRHLIITNKEVEETWKWSMPHYDYKGIMIAIGVFKRHVTLFFHKGNFMQDLFNLFEGEGNKTNRVIKFTTLDEIDDDIILAYVNEAIRVNDAGIKMNERTADQKAKLGSRELIIPDDLMVALDKNMKAKELFENFAYTHKKEYIEWIEEAKRPETRAKRIGQAIEWMAEGKSRNWKYTK